MYIYLYSRLAGIGDKLVMITGEKTVASLMSVFEFNDYKEFVRARIASAPKRGRGELQRISKALSIHPTWISHVFKGEKHLSLEQASTLCEYFELTGLEADYFLLLVQRAKSGSQGLSKMLDRQMSELRTRVDQLVYRVSPEKIMNGEDLGVFYSNWYYSGIRLMTSIPGCNQADEIRRRLDLPVKLIKETLEFLVSVGLCKKNGEKFEMGPGSTHLESSSKLISHHHTNWRLKAMEAYSKMSEADVAFSSPLTISHEDALEVRKKILELIQEVATLTKKSSPEKLRCLNIDWVSVESAQVRN